MSRKNVDSGAIKGTEDIDLNPSRVFNYIENDVHQTRNQFYRKFLKGGVDDGEDQNHNEIR